MDLLELKAKLEQKLNKRLSARVFLDSLRVIDEASRQSAAYNDPLYVPFYYWLGTFAQPKSLIEIGFRLGLFSANFLRACKTVQLFLAFQEKTEDYYSPRLARANVKSHYRRKMFVHVGNIHDERFEFLLKQTVWDLVIINEEVSYDLHRLYLDVLWSKLSIDGLICMDYIGRHKPAKDAYYDFCRTKSRDPVLIATRYGVGLIKK